MLFASSLAVAAAVLPAVYAQQTITVTVGEGGATYNPSTVTAAVGDQIVFDFVGGNHTVTQSTFTEPCTQMTNPRVGVDSGFVDVATMGQNQWSITVDNASAPLWFYCKQGRHCQSGMVFSVNPTQDRTHEQFVANAAAATSGGNQTAVSSAGASGAPSSAGGPATGAPTGATSAGGSTATGASRSDTASGSGTGTADGSQPSDDPDGALSIRSSAAGLLTIVGIVAGLML